MSLTPLPPPALAALNHLLSQSHWARQRLQPFAGRVARFNMAPFDGAFVVTDEGNLASPPPRTELADVTISLPATAPLLMLQGLEVMLRAVRLEGTVDFAEALGFVLKNLRWDAEEDLSKAVGDIAAHRLVEGAQKFAGWQKQAAQNVAENFAEYFTEELPMIARKDELTAFAAEVDRLRDDLARLEKRLQRLG
jgi:ubiquinone biosynthesis protein UbiJ